ncbi:hypothetical protein P7C71_g2476, partial [Lecanoromycetidae sp. Uapishka_2]
MCKGTLETHADCRHHRKIVNAELCDRYDHNTYICYGVANVVQERIITTPSLCRSCHCLVEDDIFRRCKDAIANTEREIAELKGDFEGETDGDLRREIEECWRTLELVVGDLKKKRDRELAEFRSGQGVWGDG